MENLVVLLLIALVLLGCSSPKAIHSWENMQPRIDVNITEDFTELREKYNIKIPIQGLTVFKNNKCYIYILPLLDVYDDKAMCVAGHELFHCIYGHYHTAKNADSCTFWERR